jgi:hypothetical protein
MHTTEPSRSRELVSWRARSEYASSPGSVGCALPSGDFLWTGLRSRVRPQLHATCGASEIQSARPHAAAASSLIVGRKQKAIRSAGQKQPGDLSRFTAQGLSSSEAPPKKVYLLQQNPLMGDSVADIRGSVTDAFFGASPVVASALGIRSGATPRGRFHHKPLLSPLSRQQDISTLLGIGHFYFALTRGSVPCSGGVQRSREG